MRTNIDIDDALMDKAMSAGPYKTKKETVEAGLKLLARQAAYREILKWQGKLKWEGDESIDWTKAPPEPDTTVTSSSDAPMVAQTAPAYADASPEAALAEASPPRSAHPKRVASKRRAGR